MTGDILARGGKSAVFGPPQVSAKRWEEIWADYTEEEHEDTRKKLKKIVSKE